MSDMCKVDQNVFWDRWFLQREKKWIKLQRATRLHSQYAAVVSERQNGILSLLNYQTCCKCDFESKAICAFKAIKKKQLNRRCLV